MTTNTTARADGAFSTAIGAGAHAKEEYSVAFGDYSTAAAPHATAIGTYAAANGANSIAIGTEATANGDGTIQLGSNALPAPHIGAGNSRLIPLAELQTLATGCADFDAFKTALANLT